MRTWCRFALCRIFAVSSPDDWMPDSIERQFTVLSLQFLVERRIAFTVNYELRTKNCLNARRGRARPALRLRTRGRGACRADACVGTTAITTEGGFRGAAFPWPCR